MEMGKYIASRFDTSVDIDSIAYRSLHIKYCTRTEPFSHLDIVTYWD